MHHSMRYKLARTAAFCGVMALGLGSAQAALASPAQGSFNVPCFTPALYYALGNASDGEVLTLAPGCTYVLDSALPDIDTNLTIIGDGATLRRADDAPSFTILSVYSGNVSISTLSFVNGGGPDAYEAGAIYNDGGNLSINGGNFVGNTGDEYAGAIQNDSGTLTVSSSRFTGNVDYYDYGGAITNFDVATVTSSTFTGNRSEYDGDGGGDGGAIENEGPLQVNYSTFTGNSTNGVGGALYNDDQATLLDDNLTGNSAYQGGGIYNDDTVTVTTSSITGNRAYDDGGGIYNDDETVYLHGDYINDNRPDNCVPFIFGCHD